ncbi:MAG: DNA repair protein RecO [Ruminococcus sp.]|nr:DNA repair protein RecO [Ruminococcus sp.]
MKFQTDGLVIKEQNIGENDRLIWVLTRTHGVVRAFARGAKKLKSGKCAPTSLLAYSRFTFYKTRESYSAGDAISLRVFSKLRGDVKKMCLAQYFCELALTVCPQEQPAEPFLRLFLNAVYLLSEGKRGEWLVKPCVEMRFACMAGYMPDLLMCRSCGAYTATTMYFLPRTGTLECDGCHSRGEAVLLGEAALTALRHTVYADDDKLFSFSLSDEGLAQLNRATEAYLRQRFEKDFATLQFYKTISQSIGNNHEQTLQNS